MQAKITIEVEYEWKPVINDEGKRYSFPMRFKEFKRGFRSYYNFPAIYRWVIRKNEEIIAVYIGEAENIGRRVYGYINPGPSQQTNKRLNSLFHECISTGLKVELELLKIHKLRIHGYDISPVDLSGKHLRLLLENLMIEIHRQNGYVLLNKDVEETVPKSCREF
ncbi:hypothetical protein [Thermococcus sp.]|uniref:hypothetical protein n=1 Tax=Thermococcus sp. TaxID=35749 RepID=UPI00260264F1|nr:hypothetical protein [Thermococcus sp.]